MRVISEEPEGAEGTAQVRVIGVLDGVALGMAVATVIAALGIKARSSAYLSSWTQERTESARHFAVAVGGTAVVLAFLVLVVWLVDERREPRRTRRWPTAALAGAALFVTAWLVAWTDLYVWPPAAAGGLLAFFVVVLAKISSRPPSRTVIALTAAVIAAGVGGTALAMPQIRHRVPPRELVDWWAAHNNPPIAFQPSLSILRTALEEEKRDVKEVENACREMRSVFVAFAGEPQAPLKVRPDVEVISDDLVGVADRCESEAPFITADEIVTMLNSATSSPASQRFDAALNP